MTARTTLRLLLVAFACKLAIAQQTNDAVLALQQCQGTSLWTIHGLWPNWASSCQGSAFDESQVTSIESQLKQYWLSCPEYHDTDVSFWTHEWSKHGTCWAQRYNTTQLEFFSLGLKLYNQYKTQCSGSGTARFASCRLRCRPARPVISVVTIRCHIVWLHALSWFLPWSVI